ncbi:P-selectin glycoprotein ligand 1-like [Triplophysa dalaica]|uniref:P-selectin glycoprotein ligand 1 n=1 Tax=Triplophysa dalaica TaxID=1582913 RepID=UPI0024DFBB46|nr:P-selectin glycoprotein ligand 1 [Triplophysa dalaica]XP_056601744.1 P-selectin glycoprotein ligand 1-like [Triplophysa dalaica]
MTMVTNRLCLSVLVLLLAASTSVRSRYLRMKRDIGLNPMFTKNNDSTANVTEAQAIQLTTVQPLASYTTHATEETGDISRMSSDHQHASDMNHTRESKVNETSEKSNHTAGTESMTVHPSKGNETTLYTQAPVRNASTGRITQTGSTAPTLPASPLPGKVTEMHTTASKAKTTTTKQTSKALPCPTASLNRDGLVSRCLIAIASVAAVTTIFIISTICLATKLSTYRYRYKSRLLQETEMVCISALMNDTDHPVPKPRHPKSNGALIPNGEDGDPDGDNLTLNSFLPDTEGPL